MELMNCSSRRTSPYLNMSRKCWRARLLNVVDRVREVFQIWEKCIDGMGYEFVANVEGDQGGRRLIWGLQRRLALRELFCDRRTVRCMFLARKDKWFQEGRWSECNEGIIRSRWGRDDYLDRRTGDGKNKKTWHRPEDEIPRQLEGVDGGGSEQRNKCLGKPEDRNK